MFESKVKRRIRELEEENKFLREEAVKQRARLEEVSAGLKKAVEALEKKNGEFLRSAFAAEIGLLPCESPACQFCKNAVWRTEADGRHIAGCKKGIQCADFEEREEEQRTPPTPPPVGTTTLLPIGIPAFSPHYPGAACGVLGGSIMGGSILGG